MSVVGRMYILVNPTPRLGRQRFVKFMQNGLETKEGKIMLSRRYVKRRVEKRGFWNPGNGRIYVEGAGLLSSNHLDLAEAVCMAFSHEAQVLYLMPSRGRWNDKRGQYPGKADWEKTGLELGAYYRNHSATIVLSGGDSGVDIVPVGTWFSSVTEETYMSDVIRAMVHLKDLLIKNFQPIEVAKGKHDEYRIELQSTPARTGMDLLRGKLPYGIKYEDLPPDVEKIVMSEFGQARTELFDHGRDTVENLHNYDGLWMYASCCRHMPVGEIIHDNQDKYEKYITGLYRVTACVPHDWNHIGLLPMRKGDKSSYPNMPGYTFESWCSHRDLALAYQYGWDIQFIHERVLWPDTQAKGKKIGQDPLRHWMESLVRLRQEVANQYPEPIRSLLRDAFRALLNHTIGSLHRGKKTVDIYTKDFSEDPGEGAYLIDEGIDGSFHYQKWEELNDFQKESFKPHWALEVWNQAKWKITKSALEVPYEHLLSIRTDGLWTTQECTFDNTNKPGCLREKDLVYRGPFDWPRGTFADVQFLAMIQRARNG